jgi:2-oxo-4-hydroxy-4-carboxy-5-ureidoimidazoline decarboxylase
MQITKINHMTQPEFTQTFGTIFEDTPTIAAAAWSQRPFQDGSELYERMCEIVKTFSSEQKIALIRAHPDLGGKAKMAEASVQEQSGVGLDRLTPDEYQRFHTLNQTYREKFEFPFIIAVRNHTKESILAAFEERLNHTAAAELDRAIAEILEIARFRLMDLLQ